MINLSSEISSAVFTSFIDQSLHSDDSLRPKLLYNDTHTGRTVLADLTNELQSCKSFWFSVAFITKSGLIVLKDTLKQLENKGVKGRILTTDYLYFNEPDALKDLLHFSNLEVRIFSKSQFHTKGYMFKNDEQRVFIVGSSNLTQTALKSNKEWNLKFTALKSGDLISQIDNEFNYMWLNAVILTDEWIDTNYAPFYYQKNLHRTNILSNNSNNIYDNNLCHSQLTINKPINLQLETCKTPINKAQIKSSKLISNNTQTALLKLSSNDMQMGLLRLTPNSMQIEALKSLSAIRNNNQSKALLISATGTGKTYLSAFDVYNFSPKRMLFLSHREQILKQAIASFKDIFGQDLKIGLLTGTSKDFHAPFLFSTVQTISKENIYTQFTSTAFDYIIVDEAHRAGAEGYLRFLEYFKPKFLLGMTATPERMDNFDVYHLFDYNIAYEVRLNRAMEEDLLCPFHYFGISEILIDGKVIDDTDFPKIFPYLTSKERVDNIIDKLNFYGHSGDRARGLIFCRKIEEADALSRLFNQRGYLTVSINSKSDVNIESSIRKLEQKNREDGLDYIFTVDMFNEGVDIPAINQIIMLRPTKSSIVFIQQLGRGLRKYRDKKFVVIMDFIGNYNNNFMIPIALSGDQTYDKDTIRKYVAEGNRIIPGCSTINFDEISKKRIYESIDKARFDDYTLLKQEYFSLKNKIGRIPKMQDFYQYNAIDIMRIIEKFGSYHLFLKKVEKDYTRQLSSAEENIIKFISKQLSTGKRIHELELLKNIVFYYKNLFKALNATNNKPLQTTASKILKRSQTFQNLEVLENSKYLNFKNIYKQLMSDNYGIKIDTITEISIINVLTNQFKNWGEECVLIKKQNNDYIITDSFKTYLANPDFYDLFNELIDLGINRYHIRYRQHYKDTDFVLYEKYTYEDVCRILKWKKNINPQAIGGYFYDETTATVPVFINYVKASNLAERISYDHGFLSSQFIQSMSKPKRNLNSKEMTYIVNGPANHIRTFLFVRKNKKDGNKASEFYFLGEMFSVGKAELVERKNVGDTVIKFLFKLDIPVREDIYEYFTTDINS